MKAPLARAFFILLPIILIAGCQTPDMPFVGGDDGGRYMDRVVDDPAGPPLTLAALNEHPRSIYQFDYNVNTTIVEDQGLRDYVRSVVAKLAANVPAINDEAEQIDVFVTSELSFGAAVTPTDDMLVSLGLIQQVENEDQMAFILAHELAHVALDHINRDKVLEAQYRGSEMIKFLGTLAQMMSNTDVNKTSQGIDVQTDEEAFNRKKRQIELAIGALQIVAEGIIDTAWNRRQENEADKLGLDIYAAAGYTTSQISPTFEKLIEDNARSSARTQLLVRRIVALVKEMSELSTQHPLRKQLQSVMIDGMAAASLKMLDELGSRHEAIRKRNEAVLSYAVETKQNRPGKPKTELLEAARGNGWSLSIQREIEAAWAANEVFSNFADAAVGSNTDESGLIDAIDMAKRATGESDMDLAFPRLTAFLLLKQDDDLDEAIDFLKPVEHRSAAGPGVMMNMAVANARLQRPDAAYASLESLEKLYDPATLYPLRARLDYETHNYEAAQVTLNNCFTQSERYIALGCEQVAEAYRQQAEAEGKEVEGGSGGLFQGMMGVIRQGVEDAGKAFNDIKTGGESSVPALTN